LRELGVHLAIDHFGIGHSPLSRLRRYPIDTLKVDHSFTAALTPDAPAPDVLILALGTGLGMNVIAEGVQNDEQLAALRILGCPQASKVSSCPPRRSRRHRRADPHPDRPRRPSDQLPVEA